MPTDTEQKIGNFTASYMGCPPETQAAEDRLVAQKFVEVLDKLFLVLENKGIPEEDLDSDFQVLQQYQLWKVFW